MSLYLALRQLRCLATSTCTRSTRSCCASYKAAYSLEPISLKHCFNNASLTPLFLGMRILRVTHRVKQHLWPGALVWGALLAQRCVLATPTWQQQQLEVREPAAAGVEAHLQMCTQATDALSGSSCCAQHGAAVAHHVTVMQTARTAVALTQAAAAAAALCT
jgi:hypothetical protein